MEKEEVKKEITLRLNGNNTYDLTSNLETRELAMAIAVLRHHAMSISDNEKYYELLMFASDSYLKVLKHIDILRKYEEKKTK